MTLVLLKLILFFFRIISLWNVGWIILIGMYIHTNFRLNKHQIRMYNV